MNMNSELSNCKLKHSGRSRSAVSQKQPVSLNPTVGVYISSNGNGLSAVYTAIRTSIVRQTSAERHISAVK